MKVLELLASGPLHHRQLLDRGASAMSILSTLDAKYTQEFTRPGVRGYHLTDLGREALAQWRAENAAVEVSSGY